MNEKEYFVDQLLGVVVINPSQAALFKCYEELKAAVSFSEQERLQYLDEAFEQVLLEWITS